MLSGYNYLWDKSISDSEYNESDFCQFFQYFLYGHSF